MKTTGKGAESMPKVRESGVKEPKKRRKPLSDEARLNRLVSLAYDAAEEQLLNGTASASVITQILKMGSLKEQLEIEKLRSDTKLSHAKIERLESDQRMEEGYMEAIAAMKRYSGSS